MRLATGAIWTGILGGVLLLAPVAGAQRGLEAARPNLRCASAMCHSPEAMALLTPAYAACMAGSAALRREPAALAGCAGEEAAAQERARLALKAKLPLPEDAEPAAIVREWEGRWVRMRSQLCAAIALDYEGDSARAVVQQCRAYVTAERRLYLDHVAAKGSYF